MRQAGIPRRCQKNPVTIGDVLNETFNFEKEEHAMSEQINRRNFYEVGSGGRRRAQLGDVRRTARAACWAPTTGSGWG